MTLGFTGTQRGMTQLQRAAVHYLFGELLLSTLHHGCCKGADAQAHKMAKAYGARRIGHPPTNQKNMMLLASFGENDLLCTAEPYLKRNGHIAEMGVDGLVAAPKEKTEQLRSGTWSTIRMARKLHRRIWLVFPDGTFKEEA